MKTINFLIRFISTVAFILIVSPVDSTAQRNAMNKEGAKVATNTYCGDFISETRAALEKKANADCSTIKTTIPCRDYKSGLDVHVTMIVQPTKSGCPNRVVVKDITDSQPLSRGSAKPQFTVEVLQKQCSRGGVTLTAYVPGNDVASKKKLYDFEWMANGEAVDSDELLECTSAEKITLKVVEIATNQMIIKSVTPDAVADPGTSDYQMVGFEKTPCFGTCPVFKVAIQKSGKATWKGISNVEKMGDWEAKLDDRTLKAIKDQAYKLGYFDLYDKYPIEGEVADATITKTFLRFGDMQKSVKHTFGGPDNLVAFENYLNEIINKMAWKRIPIDSKR